MRACKACSKCGILKPLNEFYKGCGRGGHRAECILCHLSVLKTPEGRKRINLRNNQAKDRAIAYLGGKCKDCGGGFIRDVYDFHHRNTKDKAFTLSQRFARSWEVLKPELDKCDLLCANCHRIRHHEQREHEKT